MNLNRVALKVGPYMPSPVRRMVKRMVPADFWTKATSIYPMDVPPLDIAQGLDVLLVELPQRYMPLVPVGAGYVANILAGMKVNYQVVDFNLWLYHRFHSWRILQGSLYDHVALPSFYRPPNDPWDTLAYTEWQKDGIVDYFIGEIYTLADLIVAARPSVLAIPLSETNRLVARRLVDQVRKLYPGMTVLVGGYDCVYPEVTPHVNVDYDYAVIGEAEGVLPELLQNVLAGKIVRNQAGVLSKCDTHAFEPGRIVQNLDALDFPRYEWALKYYQSYQGATVIPIVASRGCVWGRCRFCAEAWQYRKRSPKSVVDEMAYFVKKGYNHFHFNDSDILGTHMLGICEEIIRRGLHKSTINGERLRWHGQCRIQKDGTPEFYATLKRAGCQGLAFGVDGWSDHVAQLQNKGYRMSTVETNLRNCHKVGIPTAVNMVIGVPGETDDDVTECIENIVRMGPHIDSFQNLNLLSLFVGSVYWREPEKYDIKFRQPLEEIIAKNHYFAPADQWYSENPYIDQPVRVKRMQRIYQAIKQAGINTPDYADWQVKNAK